MDSFTCVDCGKTKPIRTDGGIGWLGDGLRYQRICYVCTAVRDKATMIEKGHSRNLPLYWDGKRVTNWPGTLAFTPIRYHTGRHNLAGTRTDVWFNGPDGFVWHGYQLGEFTQVLHAKRTKERAR